MRSLRRGVLAGLVVLAAAPAVAQAGTVEVTVTTVGGAAGTVTSSPAGIDCGATCSAPFADGSTVALTPQPAAGSAFAGWAGACSGFAGCAVPVGGGTTEVTAFFAPARDLTVTRAGTGTGNVVSDIGGIDCGPTCSAPIADLTNVRLTASAAADAVFTGWSGDVPAGCADSGPECVVQMTAARDVVATFTALRTLGATIVGGGGTVDAPAAALSCRAACSADLLDGTPVTLTATPDAGRVFLGWDGACTGTGPCAVTMDAARSVTATFAEPAILPPPVGPPLTPPAVPPADGAPAVTPTPAPRTCRVPTLRGLTVNQATRRLRRAGCRGRVVVRRPVVRRGFRAVGLRVAKQSQPARRVVPRSTRIILRLRATRTVRVTPRRG